MVQERGRLHPLSKLAFEVCTIVFGVLLALGVNEWRTNQANDALAERTLAEIRDELEENQERIDNTLKEHEELAVHLGEAMQRSNDQELHDISYTFNYSRTFWRKRAWQSAIITQAAQLLDISLVQQLTDIYELIESYDDHEIRVLASMGSPAFYDEERLDDQLRANLFNVMQGNQLGKLINEKINVFSESNPE